MVQSRGRLLLAAACCWLAAAAGAAAEAAEDSYAGHKFSDERVVFQTAWGDIEFAFLPTVAPITAQHIFKLITLGAFNSNHIFRVDKGFVAQVAAVIGGRTIAMNREQQVEAEKQVPLEVKPEVKHTEGVLSMGRYDDPNSGTSSFSLLLGAAPHLDMQYTIFGKVTAGMDVLHKLEGLETRREGIFVMPKQRVAIESTHFYYASRPLLLGSLAATSALPASEDTAKPASPGAAYCAHLQDELDQLRKRFDWQSEELHRVRHKCLPGTR